MALSAGLVPSQAQAETPIPDSQGSPMVAVLTIEQGGQTTVTRFETRIQNDAPVTTETSSSPAPASARPARAVLKCNKIYIFSNTKNSYSIQHRCGATSSPWGLDLSSKLCSIVTSAVHEDGMRWSRDGVERAKQAQHTVGCEYYFHGTYNPDRDGDFISYADTFTFKTVGNGNGTLNVYGSFTTTGTPA